MPLQQIRAWAKRTLEAASESDRDVEQATERAMRGLHNIQPTVNILLRTIENAVNAQAGITIDDRLGRSPSWLSSCYYAADLLAWMINSQHELINPDRIDHGKSRPKPIFQLLDRLVRSFQVLASSQKKSIALLGKCHELPQCYESLSTMCFILLDNAVKYSLKEQAIEVRVNVTPVAVQLRFDSYGPAIKNAEISQIFEAGVRGVNATAFESQGTGRGLYVAQLIAKKHGTCIDCIAPAYTTSVEGIPCGTNTFVVDLHLPRK